ncbi:poly-gamma-glutamate hydrolase family protein [Streptomyces alfalfae]|uniref:Poly-gamma-glutamate hydrolase family protein n=1 Tax=Streptomyces alfalfae TaxID=1642299 RepID=A0A7T4PDH8_9ACTN|nr:poly-gamma-glutamate hydrolase family protein [Streptomyces alfalfae]QQC88150.1 poly-gamma-glutamate hydrolase family protein [Streptomyces alfalfae]
MADLYGDWAELAAAEVDGVDYRIRSTDPAGASLASIAIHGGGIEAGSGEMAREVAGTWLRYYELDGMKSSGNGDLHITSTNYDEPRALALVTTARGCLSFHGYQDDDRLLSTTAIGGRDTALAARAAGELRAAGFTVTAATGDIAGTNPANICNRTLSGSGVQLEMSQALRRSFFPGGDLTRPSRESGARTEAFFRYAAALRSACTVPAPAPAADRSELIPPTRPRAGSGRPC